MIKEFNNIFCILKRSGYDYYHSKEERIEKFKNLSSNRRKQLLESHKIQTKFIDNFKKKSDKVGLKNIQYVKEKNKRSISPTEQDLVISCGGDGSFLSCAQDFENSILLGMNSHYDKTGRKGSIGALTVINESNYETKLKKIIEGDFRVENWNRLQAKINDKIISRYAVNDIYIGSRTSYETCNITIRVGKLEENFQCSGVIACTGMGSHAWFYNAGGSPFSNELNAFGYRVLIPNIKRPLKFTSGVLSDRNEIEIFLQQDFNVLSYDSKRNVIEPQLGDKITIGIAKDRPVKVIRF